MPTRGRGENSFLKPQNFDYMVTLRLHGLPNVRLLDATPYLI